MTGALAFGLWFLTWAPNHGDLVARVVSADALERRLVPWQAMVEPAVPLWVSWHERPVLGPALFISDEDWQGSDVLLFAGTERLLPRLLVPRLLLRAEHFRNPRGRLRKLEILGPDSADWLLRALLAAYFDRVAREDEGLSRELRTRADVLMAEVPVEHRIGAYRSALLEFGAHIFSITHEVGRHQRRRLARGETLCAVLEHPASLFSLWRQALEEGQYHGYKPVSAQVTGPRNPLRPERWVRTRARLDRADKDWLLRRLGVEWRGRPVEDFGFLCPQAVEN